MTKPELLHVTLQLSIMYIDITAVEDVENF